MAHYPPTYPDDNTQKEENQSSLKKKKKRRGESINQSSHTIAIPLRLIILMRSSLSTTKFFANSSYSNKIGITEPSRYNIDQPVNTSRVHQRKVLDK